MKIERVKLIAAVNDALRQLEERERASVVAHEAETRARVAAYVERHRQAWQWFAAAINDRLRVDEPVTVDDVPSELRGRYGETLAFYEFHRRDAVPVTETAAYRDLTALKRVLEATTDDTVSTYALEKMGFSLGKVLRGRR